MCKKLVSKGKFNFKVSHIHEKMNILNYRLQIQIPTPQIARSRVWVYFTAIFHPLLWNSVSQIIKPTNYLAADWYVEIHSEWILVKIPPNPFKCLINSFKKLSGLEICFCICTSICGNISSTGHSALCILKKLRCRNP